MSSMLINSQLCLSNLTANQGSAWKSEENSFNWLMSSLARYLCNSADVLHSIANLLILLVAIISLEGYFIEPEPATLTAAQPFFQNLCTKSLSALRPFDFLLID